jgi:comEA protein
MVGFTRSETRALLFLIVTFVVGVGVWTYRNRWAPLPELSEARRVEQKATPTTDKKIETRKADTKSGQETIILNDADREELESLPGVGPVIAARIIEYRERHGGFNALEELIEVKGIGQQTVERLKPYLKLDQQ